MLLAAAAVVALGCQGELPGAGAPSGVDGGVLSGGGLTGAAEDGGSAAPSVGSEAEGGSTGLPDAGSGPPPWRRGLTAPGHPQTLWDEPRLDELRAALQTPAYAKLHAFARAYLDWNANRADHGAGAGVPYAQVGGYAALAELEQRDVDSALTYLAHFCAARWASGGDLNEASQLLSASLAYDLLYREPGFPPLQAACREKIAAAAEDLYRAATGGRGWSHDYTNPHNWHNHAALGVAGQALRGDPVYDAEATAWREQTDADFLRVKQAQRHSSDGSWHEGIGDGTFALESQILYWMGADRAGSQPSDDSLLVRSWGRHLLALQNPNHPRTFALTSGDRVWGRPGTEATLRYVASRFRDPFAQEAAVRWDLEGRPASAPSWLSRFEYAGDWALELAAFDPSVPALGQAMSQVPPDEYNADQGSFVMRSSWEFGATAQGLVVVLKNGFPGGEGNATRLAGCANAPGGFLNESHDHPDDFGLYLYGHGGWLLPEAAGDNCCGIGTAGNTSQDTVWHNSVTFDGQGQLGDDKVSSSQESVACGQTSHPGLFQRTASIPLHLSTEHFAIGQADGTHLYSASLGLSHALRTVVLDRETSAVVLADDLAFQPGVQHTVEQHFHAMNGRGSSVQSPWLYLDNATAPTGASSAVPTSNTVLALEVVAPANADEQMGTQRSGAFDERSSPDGLSAHAVVSTPGKVNAVRFLELLWPTDSRGWDDRPQPVPLEPLHPEAGLSLPLEGGREEWVLNPTGASTVAGGLRLDGSRTSDVGIVRYDAAGVPSRVALEAIAGALLSDQGGNRPLLELGAGAGMVEVAFEPSGEVRLSGEAAGPGVRFFDPGTPATVKVNGKPAAWSQDPTTGVVTVRAGG